MKSYENIRGSHRYVFEPLMSGPSCFVPYSSSLLDVINKIDVPNDYPGEMQTVNGRVHKSSLRRLENGAEILAKNQRTAQVGDSPEGSIHLKRTAFDFSKNSEKNQHKKILIFNQFIVDKNLSGTDQKPTCGSLWLFQRLFFCTGRYG